MSRTLDESVKLFNENMSALIKFIEQKTRDQIVKASMERVRSRLSLLKKTMGNDAPVKEASRFFIEYTDQILESNVQKREDFFMTLDIRAKYIAEKGEVPSTDEFLFSLTDSIRTMYKTISQKEKDDVYRKILTMHTCSLEYAIAMSK